MATFVLEQMKFIFLQSNKQNTRTMATFSIAKQLQ